MRILIALLECISKFELLGVDTKDAEFFANFALCCFMHISHFVCLDDAPKANIHLAWLVVFVHGPALYAVLATLFVDNKDD